MIVIKGGQVLTTTGWRAVDVAVSDARVIEVGMHLDGKGLIDATGSLVGPAFVDMHTHVREPGQTWKEDIESASRAAAAGGFSSIVAMPNTEPAMDEAKIIESVVARGDEVGLVAVIPSAAMTIGRMGTQPVDFEQLYAVGVRLFTDDGDSVTDPALLRDVMERIAALDGAIVAQHSEDHARTGDGHMHDGVLSRQLGIGGLPSAAEYEIVARDLGIAESTGARYHCQHVSTRETVDLIAKAKSKGLTVTSEVTPHHLTFDVSSLASLDTNFKMYPPLREPADRLALIDALRDGTIDVVATDHAPHTPAEKSVEFSAAPRGVIGLETAAAAVWSVGIDRDRFFQSLSIEPARLLSLEEHGKPVSVGSPANLVVFDPEDTWTPESFRSKSANSPYLGHELKGRVRATINKGTVVHQNGDSTQ